MYLIHDRDHGLARRHSRPPPRSVGREVGGGGRGETTWIRSCAVASFAPWRNDMVLHTAGNTIRLAKLGASFSSRVPRVV